MDYELINDMKSQLKVVLLAILRIVFIVFGLFYLEIKGLENILVYMLVVYCASTVSKFPQFKEWIVGFVKYALFVLCLYYFAFISMGYGILGFALYIMGLSLFKIFGTKESRGSYLGGMRRIETMIFGKTLDKENWVDAKPGVRIKLKGDKK